MMVMMIPMNHILFILLSCFRVKVGSLLELTTFEILAAERLRLMEFDNRLIIDCFSNVVNILIW